MKQVFAFLKRTQFRALAWAILLGGVIPVFSWNLWMWAAGPLDGAQFYLPTSPVEITGCCVFAITGLPAVLSLIAIEWVLGQYHAIGGVVPIFDALAPIWQGNIVLFISVMLNVLLYWRIAKWLLVVPDDRASRQENYLEQP